MKKEIITYSALTAAFLALFIAALAIAGIRDVKSPLFLVTAFLVENTFIIWLLGGAALVFGVNLLATVIKYKRYGGDEK
jgi:hypothetical protein